MREEKLPKAVPDSMVERGLEDRLIDSLKEDEDALRAELGISPAASGDADYSADDRRVHILGSLEPQLGDTILLTFTGKWSWIDGTHLIWRFADGSVSELVPAGVKNVLLYPIEGDNSWPRPWAWIPTAWIRPSHVYDDCFDIHRETEITRDWGERMDWSSFTSVPGAEFIEKGLAAFYPQLMPW